MIGIASMAFALLVAAAAPDRAPTPEETKLYDQGQRAFAAGDWRGAEQAWQAGYEAGHDPAFLVHLGEAQEKAGAPAAAADSYRRYLGAAPGASDRSDIEQRIARLAPRAPATPGAPAPAEPTGEFGGVPPPTPSAGPKARPDQTASRSDGLGPADLIAGGAGPSQGPDQDAWNRLNVTAFAATAATVAALGTAAFFAASAASHQDDVNRLLLYRDASTGAPLPYSSVAGRYQDAVRSGRNDARGAKIALVAAAGTAVVAAVFFTLDATRTEAPSLSLDTAGPRRLTTAGWWWRF